MSSIPKNNLKIEKIIIKIVIKKTKNVFTLSKIILTNYVSISWKDLVKVDLIVSLYINFNHKKHNNQFNKISKVVINYRLTKVIIKILTKILKEIIS